MSTSFSKEVCYNEDFYRNALKEFIRTTSTRILDLHLADPMSHYIRTTSLQKDIKYYALHNQLGNRVYLDTMMLFVSQYIQKTHFYQQRNNFEQKKIIEATQWSEDKYEREWISVLSHLDQKYREFGFSQKFYEHEWIHSPIEEHSIIWIKLLEEWQSYLNQNLKKQKETYILTNQTRHNLILLNNLTATQEYVRKKNLSNEDVFQTLTLMGGRWTSTEFERLHQITRLQYKYPILIKIADRIGRKEDPNGRRRVQSAYGQQNLGRSKAKNDITGIGTGKDFDSLLPSEVACFADSDLYDVFLKKYVTGQLQTFDHKSHILHSARSLHTHAANTQGPVIICTDISGSMNGEPSRIALSLTMRLTEMCEQKDRPCFLIAFDTYAQPIDIRKNRAQLLQFFTAKSTGDTDAQRMIDLIQNTLQSNNPYFGADILWITDFRIPIPPDCSLQKIELLQDKGSRFYGLQIGMAENRWIPYFDKMYHIEDVNFSIY